MKGVQITVPSELLEAAGMTADDAPRESIRLLALELYRENNVSLGRAAELCEMPIAAFMVFAGKHEAPMHYSVADLEEDRLTLKRLEASSVTSSFTTGQLADLMQINGICQATRALDYRFSARLWAFSAVTSAAPRYVRDAQSAAYAACEIVTCLHYELTYFCCCLS